MKTKSYITKSIDFPIYNIFGNVKRYEKMKFRVWKYSDTHEDPERFVIHIYTDSFEVYLGLHDKYHICYTYGFKHRPNTDFNFNKKQLKFISNWFNDKTIKKNKTNFEVLLDNWVKLNNTNKNTDEISFPDQIYELFHTDDEKICTIDLLQCKDLR